MEPTKKFLRTAIAYAISQDEEIVIKDFALKYSFRLLDTLKRVEDIVSFVQSNPRVAKFLFVLDYNKLGLSARKLAIFRILLRKNGVRLTSVTEFLIKKAQEHRKRCF